MLCLAVVVVCARARASACSVRRRQGRPFLRATTGELEREQKQAINGCAAKDAGLQQIRRRNDGHSRCNVKKVKVAGRRTVGGENTD